MGHNLRFDSVLRQYVNLAYGADWRGEIAEYVRKNAELDYALQVMDATFDAFISSVNLSHRVQEKRAQEFLRFGVARRLEMIWVGYRNLMFTAPPKRENPLDDDESRSVTADLNLIYINIRGVLDNLCWALLHEICSDKPTLPKAKIGLFLPCITRDMRFSGIHDVIQAHGEWNRDLKNRRDPAAHQIPLAVLSQTVTQHETRIYQQLEDEYRRAVAAGDFASAETIAKRQRQIGRFMPLFGHDLALGLTPIYPTTPDDVGHVIQLLGAIETFFGSLTPKDPARIGGA
jgi:hypothetical protein